MDYQGTPKDSVDNDTPIEETRKSVWALRTLCLITGASRGLGQRMAVRFAERFSSNSTLILVARNNSGLEETRASIDRIRKDVRVLTWVVDLAELNESMIHDYFEGVKASTAIAPSDFEQAIIVHNAGSMGNISELFTGQSDAEQLNKYWSMNLTSAIVLNATFWSHWSCKNMKQQRIVINISSICAKQAVKSWSIYCAGKAARDIMFATMALEEPKVLVLSYAPGPLDTEMQLVARTQTKDPEIRDMFAGLHSENRLLTCDQSLDRLIGILDANSFNSGSHIDYYDDDY